MADPMGVCDAARNGAAFWLVVKKLGEHIGFETKPDEEYQNAIKDDQALGHSEFISLMGGWIKTEESNGVFSRSPGTKHWVNLTTALLGDDVNSRKMYEYKFESSDFNQAILQSDYCSAGIANFSGNVSFFGLVFGPFEWLITK